MSNVQPFYSPKFRAFDANGNPLSGGLLYSYAPGTSTPLSTYTTRAGNVANANPVVLDANGEADVWVTPNISYKFVLKNSAGVTQWTVDNVPSLPDLALVPLLLGDGTVGAPALAFIADPDSGIYRISSNVVGMAAGGALTQYWQPTGPQFPLGIVVTQSQSASPAIQAIGNGAGPGGQFSNETAATGGTRKDAASLTNGDLKLDGVAYAASTTAVKNRLTPNNLPKAWASVTYHNGSAPTINDAFNITSVAETGGGGIARLTFTFAQAFANTNYMHSAVTDNNVDNVQMNNRSTGSFQVAFLHMATFVASSPANMDGQVVHVLFFGQQ